MAYALQQASYDAVLLLCGGQAVQVESPYVISLNSEATFIHYVPQHKQWQSGFTINLITITTEATSIHYIPQH